MADKIEIEIELDPVIGSQARNKLIKQASDIGDKSGKKFSEEFGDSVRSSSKRLLAGVAAVGAALATALASKEVIQAASIQRDAINALEQSLRSAGSFSRQASKDFQDFASSLQTVSVTGDEVILQQLAIARNFARSNEEAKKLTEAALELSAATGISLDSAVKNLGKTFAGLAGELGESVPAIRELTKEQLQSGEALDLILKRFGGAALAQTKTFSGAIDQLGNVFGDLKETLGFVVTDSPTIVKLFRFLTTEIGNVITRLNELSKGRDIIGDLLLSLIDFSQGVVTFVVKPLEGVLSVISFVLDSFGKVLTGLQSALADSLAGIAGLLDKFGIVPEGVMQSLREFKDFSSSVFESASRDAEESLKGIFKTDISDDATAFADRLRESLAATDEVTKTASAQANNNLKSISNKVKKTSIDISKSLNEGLGRGVASSIQFLAQNLAKGEGLFDGFAKFVFGLIGDLAIQIGTFVVATSIAKSSLFGPLGAGIAAGAALIVTGTLIKALAGGGGEAGGAPAGGVGGGIGGGGVVDEIVEEEAVAEAPDSTQINVVVQGDVLDSEESGLRIANILNDAFDKQGVVVKGAVA